MKEKYTTSTTTNKNKTKSTQTTNYSIHRYEENTVTMVLRFVRLLINKHCAFDVILFKAGTNQILYSKQKTACIVEWKVKDLDTLPIRSSISYLDDNFLFFHSIYIADDIYRIVQSFCLCYATIFLMLWKCSISMQSIALTIIQLCIVNEIATIPTIRPMEA